MVTHYEPVFIMVGVMYLLSAVSWLFIDSENSLDRDEESADQTIPDEPGSEETS